MNYVHIAIFKAPGAFDAPLTYKIPNQLKEVIQLGHVVEVPLKEKQVRGLVVGFLNEPSFEVELKEISNLLDWANGGLASQTVPPLLNEFQFNLASQMSIYYHSSLLRCLKLMVPRHLWKGTGRNVLKKFFKSEVQSAACEASSDIPLKPLKHELNSNQQRALIEIAQSSKPVLLKGVTGSGKTELYLRLILESVRAGKQAILLLPEISLTPQMVDYFSDYFGSSLAVFHSKLSEGKRLEEWLKVKTGQAKLVIGSRSAIFAPVADLGVLILDEEHEWTYKQESSPYYETHHVAEMLRSMTNCKLIFGTATPRLETLHAAQSGEYQLVELPARINQQALPKVHVVDLREEFKKKNFTIFSGLLFNLIQDRLQKKEQIILFVNQRGAARAVMCRDCGAAMLCPNCEVTLKLHLIPGQTQGKLMCHYCAYQTHLALSCAQCGSVNIKQVGVGTQRVEQDLIHTFPGIRVLRADKDTTSDKEGFEPIYQAFKKGDYDVLVGTQMVAKGHDFSKVTLIGLILADIGLHVPDFRSHERLFHLITQVAGRAGRAEHVGEVVLQTYQPDHPAIKMAAAYEYEVFAEKELSDRKKLSYPPFSQLIKFTVLGRDLEKLKTHIQTEKEVLEDIFATHQIPAFVLAAPAMVPKIGEFYHYHVLVRSSNIQLILDHWTPPKTWRMDRDPVHTA